MEKDVALSPSDDPSATPGPSDEIEVEIESLAYGGEGVAHTPRALFVAGAAPGDRLRVRILEQKQRWARGEILAVLTPSPSRREPPCPLASTCGGCQWQHVTEEGQREAKRRAVEDALQRIGGFPATRVPPPLFAGPSLGYRRRTRLQVAWPGGRLHLGYHAPGSRQVVDVPACAQMSPGLQRAYDALRGALRAAPALRGLGSVELAVGSEEGSGVAAFRLQSRAPRETRRGVTPIAAALVQSEHFAGAAMLDGSNRIIASWGDIRVTHHYPAGSLPGAPFTIRQLGWSFSQASFETNLLLVRTVIEALGKPPPGRVLELYAGSGNFTLPLAALGMRVCAVEGNIRAARDLSDNLARAGREAKVVAAPAKLAVARAGDLDAVLLDPPRTGAAEVIPALSKLAPPRIVYVSCDPATLARDLRQLAGRGYRIHDVKTLDLFPQTYHVECVVTCLLEKR